jgi:DNA uptake protein ComE-like DNA-binding protein
VKRRASVILAVLVVVTIAALSGATGVYVVRSQAAASAAMLKRTQARALAWSGVQAVMAELAGQREALMDGGAPDLTPEWELFTDSGGGRGVVRLLSQDEPLAVSEQGKLDLNAVTAPMLAALGLEPDLAAAIVAERGKHPYGSVEDLLRVPAVTAQVLRGEAGRAPAADGAPAAADSRPVPLGSVLTVFSFDPNIQAGLGENASAHRGKLRVNLDQPWSDRLAKAIDDRFGQGASIAVKSFIDKGAQFRSLSDIVGALRTFRLEVKDWPPVLDAFTVSPEMYSGGKVDLNRAPVEVLAAIPGLDPEIAAQIVAAREKLDSAAKASIVWPLAEGLMTQEAFAQAADWLTTRSMQWRVRLEAGTIAPAADGSRPSSDRAVLHDRVVMEAVIDVASERPRVAYLREITMQEAAGRLYESLIASGEEEAGADDGDPFAALLPPDEALPVPAPADLPEAPDLGDGRRVGPGLRVMPESPRGRRPAGQTRLQMDRLNLAGLDLGFDNQAPPAEVGPPAPEAAAGPPPGEPADRRLGRWNIPRSEGAAP